MTDAGTPRAPWRTLRAVAGFALAAAALYASVVNVEWAACLAAVRGARMFWIVVAAASVLVTVGFVTTRWARLLGLGVTTSWWSLWSPVVIGQAVNIVFPLRFGEGARVAVTCAETGLPLGRVMVAMAIERALDVGAFGAIVVLLIVAGRLPTVFGGVLPLTLALMLATMAGVAVVVRFMPPILNTLRRRNASPSGLIAWLDRQVTGVRTGWQDISRSTSLWPLVLLTALALLSSASANWLVFLAFALPVPPVAALVLLAVLQIGTAIVSVPGNIGVFQYLTITTLAAWGVPPPTGLAVAIVLHVVTLGPRVALGAVAGVRRGSRRVGE